MLKLLRGLSLKAKKKVVVCVASVITVFIFAIWAVHFSGTFSKAYETTATQSSAIFDFVEKNVGDAYNAFQSVTSSPEKVTTDISSSTESTTYASSTETISSTSTISN